MKPTKTVSGIVDQPAEVVWRLITSPKKYHALRIPHTYEPFDTIDGKPMVGATFEVVALTGGRGTMHVVDCRYLQEFSFGSDPSNWTFHFKLEALNQGTRVRFSRRFRKPSWFERLTKGSYDSTYESLAEDTLNSLTEACARLQAGQSDGLVES